MEASFTHFDSIQAFELAAGVTGRPFFRPVREDYLERWNALRG